MKTLIGGILIMLFAAVLVFAPLHQGWAQSGGSEGESEGRASPKSTDRVAEPALLGTWQGRYFYNNGRTSVPFTLTLQGRSRKFTGRMREVNTFGSRDASHLYADVRGSAQGSLVTFTKKYDGTGGQSHSVEYRGQLSRDGQRISGKWHLGGNSGRFEMSRKNRTGSR